MSYKVRCFNIEYDINEEDCEINQKTKREIKKTLPLTVKFDLPNEVNEIIIDELSNKTGWLVKSFYYDVVNEPDKPNPNTDLTKFMKEIRDNKRKALSNEYNDKKRGQNNSKNF